MINYIINFFRGSKKRGPPSVHRRVSSRVDLTPELNASHQEQNRIASERMKKRVDSYLDSLALTNDSEMLDKTITEMTNLSGDISRILSAKNGMPALQDYANRISEKANFLRNPVPYVGKDYVPFKEEEIVMKGRINKAREFLGRQGLNDEGISVAVRDYSIARDANREYALELADRLDDLSGNILQYGVSKKSSDSSGKKKVTGATRASQLYAEWK